MILRDEMKKQGAWIFRWRSFLPLLIIPICILVLFNSESIEKIFGACAQNIWECVCVAISFFGLFIRGITVGYVPRGTSGRNTKDQNANVLNTTGIYSTVRNPLYLGNFLIILGLLIFTQVWWFAIIGVLLFWIFYERVILAEEEFLAEKFGGTFTQWANKTPIIIPSLSHWEKPSLPFSLKTVLRREYSTLFAMVSSFTVLGIIADICAEGVLEIETSWLVFFFTGLAIYLLLRTLKKKTHLLDVNGR